jgi:putative transposase
VLSRLVKKDGCHEKSSLCREIVAKLRLVDELSSTGRTVGNAVQAIGVTEATYYRWKKRYGGLESDVVEWLMELEAENGRLRRAVSDLTRDNLILTEVLNGRCLSPGFRRTFVDNVRVALASPKGVRAACLGSIDRPNARYQDR